MPRDRTREYARTKEKGTQAAYRKSPAGKKASTLGSWIKRGVIMDDRDVTYQLYCDTTHCNTCNVELTTGKRCTTSKCLDHDHNIYGRENVRGIICHGCNTRDKCNNTSGEMNISPAKTRWRFKVMCWGGVVSDKLFDTFEDALAYKSAWFALNSPHVFHDPSWSCISP